MKENDFFKFVDWRVKQIVSTLTTKGKEYSTEDNKLHNFDKGAQKSGKIREEVLKGFMLKHEISVDDIIEDIKIGKLPTKELVREKVGDIIAYYILLEASIIDRLNNVNGNSREG